MRQDILKQRLEEAFRGSRFHSFLGSLKGVTEEQAVWTPPHYKGFPHMTGSILNLAFHTGGDKHVLLSTSFGDGSLTWPVMQAHFEELGGNLAAARTLAEEGHTLVLRTLEEQAEGSLDRPVPYYGGKTLTALEVFTIVAEHDLYHAGQINYVRCLIAGS